jgi:hypothetical protein
MTISMLRTTRPGRNGAHFAGRITEWERGHEEQLARIKDTFAEVTGPGPADVHSISIALKLLRTLVRASVLADGRTDRHDQRAPASASDAVTGGDEAEAL